MRSIKNKLISAILLVSLIPLIIIAVLSYSNSKNEIESIVSDQLTAIREIKANQIEEYFEQIENQVITFSSNTMITNATRNFKTGFEGVSFEYKGDMNAVKSSVEAYISNEFLPRLNENVSDVKSASQYLSDDKKTQVLQYAYISNNSNALGEKHLLEKSNLGLIYDKFHEIYHPSITTYLEKFGYYDIFIVDDDTGNIIYSVFKEADYATNLMDGPYSNSAIARVYKSALELDKNDVAVEDFDFYEPSYFAPASFIASPIYDGNDRIGVLIFQMPVDRINSIMTGNEKWQESGLGESGETYLVAEDKKIRSMSRFLIEDPEGYIEALRGGGVSEDAISSIDRIGTSILLQPVDTQAVTKALNGEVNTEIIKDYRNVNVLSSYKALNIHGLNYVILSELDEAEAFQSINQLRLLMIIIVGIATLIVLVVAWFMGKNLSSPLIRTSDILKDISEGEGDLTKALDESRKDEIGLLSKWFNLFTSKLRDMIGIIVDQTGHLKVNVDSFDGLMEDSNNNLKDIIESVAVVNESIQNNASISEEANASIEELSSTASTIYSQALDTMSNSKEVKEAVDTGQNSIDDVVGSISEVKTSSNDVVKVLSELGHSVNSIENIITLIQSIAEQTNLLALNASIEAARAGDAGRGFAVVAEEVRKLAEESNASTDKIRDVIGQVQIKMKDTLKVVNEEQGIIDQTVEKSHVTKEQFSVISKAIDVIIDQINEITKSTQQQSTIATDMSSAIETLTMSTQDNAEAVQSITNKTATQADIVAEVERGNAEIKELVAALNQITGRFIID